MSIIYFLLLNALLIFTAYRITIITLNDREPWRQTLISFVLFPVIAYFTVLPLALVGELNPLSGTIVLFFYAFVTLFVPIKNLESSSVSIKNPDDETVYWGYAAIVLFSILVGSVIVDRVLAGTSFDTDDLAYHATFSAHLIQEQGLSIVPYDYHAYFPFNTELISAWFMLPTGDDRFVYLGNIYWFSLVVLSIVAFCVSVINERTHAFYGLAVAALFSATPVIARNFGPVDLAMPALLLAAMAISLPTQSLKKNPRSHLIDNLFIGCATGLAIGAKITALPIALILWIYITFIRGKDYTLNVRLNGVLVLMVTSIMLGGFWYIRNLLVIGNPLFPAEVAFFTGPFLKIYQETTTLFWWLTTGSINTEQWSFLINGYLNWPVPLAIMSFLGFAGGIVMFFFRKRMGVERELVALNLLLICGVISFLTWPFTPFSATVNTPDAEISVFRERLLFVFVVGISLLGLVGVALRKQKTLSKVWWMLVLLAAIAVGVPRAAVGFVSGILFLPIVIFLFHKSDAPASSIKKATYPIMIVVVLVFAALINSFSKAQSTANLWAMGKKWGMVEGWKALEKLPSGSRIAVFGKRAYDYYPYFGRDLQHVPLYLNTSGKQRLPVHAEWQAGQYGWWRRNIEEKGYELSIDSKEFFNNLDHSNAEYVFISMYDGFVPPQYQYLKESEKTDEIFNDGRTAIYQLNHHDLNKM